MRKTIDRNGLIEVLEKRNKAHISEIERAKKEGEERRAELLGIRANELYTVIECLRNDELKYLY